MKYNISKLQGGGFVSFTPILKQSPTQAVAPSGASAESGSEQSSVLDQDLYKRLIQDGGLVSDVNVFVNQIQSSEQTPFGYLDSGNRSNTLKMFSKVNELRQNRENWKTAYDAAKSSGGLGEIAVGGNRELYVRDRKGDIKIIGMSEFEKNRQNYNPMTVAQLLEARSKDEKLAFDTSTFSVAEYSVGTSTIYDKINKIVDKMGSITSDKTTYVDTKEISRKISQESGLPEASEEVLQGLTQLRAAIGSGPEGIYKVTSKTITPNIQKAYDYVWNSLTEQEKNKLTANSILAGKKGNPREVVENAISSQASATTEFTPEYQKEMTDRNKLGGGSSEGMTTLKPNEVFLQGKLPTSQGFKWNDPSTGLEMEIPVMGLSKILGFDNKPLGYAKLSEVNISPIGTMSNVNGVTFGGKRISSADFNKIIAADEDAAKVYLPLKDDGTPNLNLLEKVSLANKYISEHPELSIQQINDHYEKMGLPSIKVDERGIIETDNVKPFIIFYGYTTDEVKATNNNSNIEKVEDRGAISSLLEPIFKRGEEGKESGKVPSGEFYNFGPFKVDYYKGLVAYPLHETASTQIGSYYDNLYSPKVSINEARINQNTASGKNIPNNNADLLNIK